MRHKRHTARNRPAENKAEVDIMKTTTEVTQLSGGENFRLPLGVAASKLLPIRANSPGVCIGHSASAPQGLGSDMGIC